MTACSKRTASMVKILRSRPIACMVALPVILALACVSRGRTDRDSSPAGFSGVYHVVREGQTLWRISSAYKVDLEVIQWVNDIEDVNNLQAGLKVFIPGAEKALRVIPDISGSEIEESRRPHRFIDLIWPLAARVSSGYGPRMGKMHEGIDLPAPVGTPVAAAADGKVVYSGQGMRGYGKVVVVKHVNDLSTVYAHNSRNLVREGSGVMQGQVIAEVGESGRATGPHLHFEVRRRGVAFDPQTILPIP